MELVIDTNILFSFFKYDSTTRKIISNTSLKLFAPKETFTELLKYKEEICNKSNITEKEFKKTITIISSLIEIIPKSNFIKFYEKSKEFLSDNAKDDAPFVGLALYLGVPLWSNDKALKKQGKVNVFSTSELMKLLDVKE
ncbi:MAG: hypothetical protein KAW45_04930 [Thermoplasmatales archaeon]|nr:hypothetical protein [Thermoplasmatales archaeon]